MASITANKGWRMTGGVEALGGIGTALVAGAVSILTTVLGIIATARNRRRENEASIQRIALEQSEHAFASIRADVDRYRLEVDRLRADNDRLSRISDQMAARMHELEHELSVEREARRRAEHELKNLQQRIQLQQTPK